jgi:hypothetical protein
MSTHTIIHAFSSRRADARALRSRSLAVISALAATLAVWLVAHTLAGVDLAVRSGSTGSDVTQVGAASVVLVTLLVSLAACGLRAALERLATRPRRVWNAIASATLLLSLVGPIALAQTSTATAGLVSMHLAAAGVLIPALARPTPARA